MSAKWIEERLGNAGLSQDQLDDLAMGYDSALLRVDKNGKVTEVWLDKDGQQTTAPTWRKQ